ncbi:MAG: leucine-rich repeat domain-containing protein, partial [Clostridia bacterium]|nr:leucine-rich repeat domain-containing protein [Clostridia bacterium]
IPKERVEEMAARYPDIEFGWTIHFAEHSFRTDMTAYSTLHVAKAKKHSDEYISLVRYCKNLRALDFGHNAVTDLSFLYDLPELRVLIISVNQVEDITPIASLKHLEYLEMFTNKVHDLSPLSGLTNLLDLNISWNYIDDLTPILGLKKLERLWTCRAINRDTATNLSKEQIAMLQEAIPGLDIFNGENPTGGTWRQHPRYTIVKRMFRTGVWEPFPESVPDDQT